jgi:hypothetical protein
MHSIQFMIRAAAAVSLCAAMGTALAQSSVGYGRITAVNRVDVANTGAQTGGALLGGTIGMVSGRNQSNSNQALRAGVGAFAGNRIARNNSGGQAFEYTILQGGRTTTVVTSEGGLRVGDCVSVERGGFNNLRLVDDSRCAPGARTTAPASDRRQADACVAAKDALMRAETDEAFDRAERRVRLQCLD